MIILGELILCYIVATVVGRLLRHRKGALYMVLVLISAVQVALVLYAMFTHTLEMPST